MTSITTSDADTRAAILAALDKLGGLAVQDDALRFEGTAFVLPAGMEGSISEAIDYLADYRDQQESTYSYTRTYPFRPLDGAAAFDRTMKRVFGSTGIGKPIVSLFGSRPPQFRTINVGNNVTAQVPWGKVSFTPLDATFYTGATHHNEYGIVFELMVEAPRKHRRRIEGFFDAVERELRENSIYRGKAITGSADEPMFLDLSTVDPSRVIYSADVMTQLSANLWALLDHTDQMRELNIPLKRAVLVEGPYGTGKTLAGALTAQRAVANGWTYVLCRPGVDNLMDTLRTAQLYAPAVVWFEDIDIVGSTGDAAHISRLLDALDGISTKGREVVAGFTTNHIEKLQKGLLRPGRIDTVVHIGELDAEGIERLIKVVIPAHLLGKVDYAKVTPAFTGYVPAFAREAIERAVRYSIARNGGRPDQVTTADLVNAAQGLRAQHRIMEAATEGPSVPTLGVVMSTLFEDVLTRTQLPDHGDAFEPDEVEPSAIR